MGYSKDSKGNPVYGVALPTGQRADIISPNWADPCTWYYSSLESPDEVLSDSGDGLTFNSAHANWIDTAHGRITDENRLDPKYKPVIQANGVTLTEDEPFGGTQHDYAIDYATGNVTFHASQSGKVVEATYWYENGSTWALGPESGKILNVTHVEVQFSENVVMNDTVIFQGYVYAQVLAAMGALDPAELTTNGGSINPLDKLPAGYPTLYKTMMDFINESQGALVSIPALGGGTRGFSQPLQVFQWPYAARGLEELKSSLGAEIRVSLENDQPFTAENVVASFYATSEDE